MARPPVRAPNLALGNPEAEGFLGSGKNKAPADVGGKGGGKHETGWGIRGMGAGFGQLSKLDWRRSR